MILSFGHSTLTAEAALGVLGGFFRDPVEVVIDARSHPTSRYPHWDRSQLQKWLPGSGIEYEWWPALGGWADGLCETPTAQRWTREVGLDLTPYEGRYFPKGVVARKVDPGQSPGWTVGGFWDYQWFMTEPAFKQAAAEIVEIGSRRNVAIMCAEVLPWSCHRSMIADYLWLRFEAVTLHLQPTPTYHGEMSSLKHRLARYDRRVRKDWGM